MSFRDDHDVALARIHALERELAETKAELSDKERTEAGPEEERAEANAEKDRVEPPPPAATARTPRTVGNRTEHGVTIRSTGSVVRLSWFGWGTGNFVSAMLLFPLPFFAIAVLVLWLASGMPAGVPFALPMPLFILAAVVAVWNTATLTLNRRNRISVGPWSLSATQGVVPWLVGYRRRLLPIADIRGFEIDCDWDPETDVTQYRVRARHGSARTPVTAWTTSENRARLIATELATATRTSVT